MRRVLAMMLLSLGCEAERATTPQGHTQRGAVSDATASAGTTGVASHDNAAATSMTSTAPVGAATGSASAAPTPSVVRPCTAPSLGASDPIDGRSDSALDRCVSPTTGSANRATHCGKGDVPALDLARLDEAVLPFDAATEAHVKAIAANGKTQGRRPNVFGLIGDSMTVSGAFLRPFAREETTKLAPAVEQSLTFTKGNVIELFRGVEAQRVRGVWRDSFSVPRAAKVGARAPWPLEGGKHAPVSRMIEQLSPAVAVILYGGNDAAYRSAPVDELADDLERDLDALLDRLEAAGIVPILNTVARHGDAPGFDACGPRSRMTNWRIAVQTNALSARVVKIACRRHLPLIDLRHALDAAEGHGISSDGIHPSSYHLGAGILDERGLRCGYNVRNYVTMKMLAQVAARLP